MSVRLDEPLDVVAARLCAWIASDACPFAGVSVGDHFQLTIPKGDPASHFWSPHLTLEILSSDTGTEVAGRFNPSPAIWTAYLLGSLVLLTVAAGGSMWGVAQVMLHQTPWAFLAMPICFVVGAIMWWASAVGQRLAGAQMTALREGVENAVSHDERANNTPSAPTSID